MLPAEDKVTKVKNQLIEVPLTATFLDLGHSLTLFILRKEKLNLANLEIVNVTGRPKTQTQIFKELS